MWYLRGIFVVSTYMAKDSKIKVTNFLLIYAVMLGLYVDYSSRAMEHVYTVGRHIYSGAYANNVKCSYASVVSHIVDCSEFI